MSISYDQIPWRDPRKVLSDLGYSPKRDFSQNFLVSKSVIEKIASLSVVNHQDHIVELGPGLGTLTAALLRLGAEVTVIEKDRDMISALKHELGHIKTLHIIEADAATFDLTTFAQRLDQKISIVGNLPYAITGPIFRNLVKHHASFSQAVLMIQREVRDRLIASVGTKAYGPLTIFTHAVFQIAPAFLVSAGSFFPPPRIQSAVIKCTPLETPRAIETESFRSIVRAIFQHRRKTSRNALIDTFHSVELVDNLLQATLIDGKRRGETFTIDEINLLAHQLELLRPSPCK